MISIILIFLLSFKEFNIMKLKKNLVVIMD